MMTKVWFRVLTVCLMCVLLFGCGDTSGNKSADSTDKGATVTSDDDAGTKASSADNDEGAPEGRQKGSAAKSGGPRKQGRSMVSLLEKVRFDPASKDEILKKIRQKKMKKLDLHMVKAGKIFDKAIKMKPDEFEKNKSKMAQELRHL